MSPLRLKAEQHARYDAEALAVVKGEKGYKPAEKPRYSKASKIRTKHVVSFA
ncbi:hypothetical protein [[Erwinia] mediterraneensis]|uniref:hypothetical protein n=1 Tax=[Erwinia] mediterraneensis TaxID=2161819 RepID=UPI0013EF23B5|nr:hypothetical protein [[Erwinia] mediterraneensis]